MSKGRPICNRSQKGAVLIVGLLLLVSLTILTIGGVRSVGMNENLAANSHLQNRRFQAAESAGGYALNQDPWVNQTLVYMQDPTFNSWPSYTTVSGDTEVSAEVVLEAKKAMIMGYTLNVNASSSYVHLQVSAEATVGSSDTSTQVVQGFVRVGAG